MTKIPSGDIISELYMCDMQYGLWAVYILGISRPLCTWGEETACPQVASGHVH